MTDRRLPIIVSAIALAVAIAVAVVSCRPAVLSPSAARELPGAGAAGTFGWASSDHAPIGDPVSEPGPGEVPVPEVPLPSDVTFERGRATLADPATVDALLAPVVAAALIDADLHLTIDAHASADGEMAANLELSLHRGEAIRSRLVDAGVPIDRIQVVAHGENDLPVPDEPDSAANRVVGVSATHTVGGR